MESSILLVENKIKNVLVSKRMQPNAENVSNACAETILELNRRGNSSFEDLANVMVKCKAFKPSKINLSAIDLICKYYPTQANAILKQFFKDYHLSTGKYEKIKLLSETSYEYQLLQILLKHSRSKGLTNILTKNYEFYGYFNQCDNEQKVNLFINGIAALEDNLETCFKNCLNIGNNSQVIHAYLEFKYENNQHLTFGQIKEIVEYLEPECLFNYKIIFYILHFNNFNINKIKSSTLLGNQVSKANSASFEKIFTLKLVGLIRDEFFNEKNTEDKLLELLSLMSNSILPDFIPLIKELNDAFLREGKYVKILKSIATYISIPDFIDIIGNFDIFKHHQVIRGISNVDISVFIELYKIYSPHAQYSSSTFHQAILSNNYRSNILSEDDNLFENEPLNCLVSRPGQESLDILISILPHACYYCSDYRMNIRYLLMILRDHLETHRSTVCNALERLVQSHSSNIINLNALPNPVSKEQSMTILNEVAASGIVFNVISAFQQTKNNECDAALQLLVDLTGIDITAELIPAVNSDNHKTCLDALRLLVFFVKKISINFDFISSLIELCSSNETDIQKKAYYLLYSIYNQGVSPFCICEYVFYSLEKSAQLPSQKNRALLQYAILQRGCNNCKAGDKDEIQMNFLKEMLKNLKSGNSKCRKLIKEMVVSLSNDIFFRQMFISFLSSKNNDNDILVGSLECSLIILEHITQNVEYLDRNAEFSEINFNFCIQIIEKALEVSLYSVDVVRPIISIFKLVIQSNLLGKFEDLIALTVDSYISQFSKKYNRELKDFCYLAQKTSFTLTKTMKTLLKFKNKSGKEKDIQVKTNFDFNKLI